MDKDALDVVNAYYEKMYGKDVIKAFVKISVEDLKLLAHGINFGEREIIKLIDCELITAAQYKPEIKRMLDLYKFRSHST